MSDQAVKVAIIGGGCAGVTAAFELTRPEHKGLYQVTIYQMGWRLGGKGASGRGVHGRIEEHGLHLWMGFYENAFRVLRECYEELGRSEDHQFATWRDAFTPDPFVGVTERTSDGWQPWSAYFPAGSGDPGDPLKGDNPFTISSYMVRAVRLLQTLFDSILVEETRDRSSAARAMTARDLIKSIKRYLDYGQVLTLAGLSEATQLVALALEKLPELPPTNEIHRLLDAITGCVRNEIARQVGESDEVRRLWEIADVVLACLNGAIRFDLLVHEEGFDAINDYDWREWLLLNGASQGSVDSAFMRGVYDLLFAYEQGDPTKPKMAAGQALRGAVRMFLSYRGALFWKMRAGMGDIVFAPFYEVLRDRGVTFNFFHRVEKLRLAQSSVADEKPYIDAIDLSVQAEVKSGEYNPLVDVNGVPSWLAAPDFDQLEGGAALRLKPPEFEDPSESRICRSLSLKVTKDFDFVVLATGLGAVSAIAEELIENNDRWAQMVDKVATVPTQAFQLWMNEDMASLGWLHPPINLSGFVTPFDTWADMTHLVVEEQWPEAPRSIAYFCSALQDGPGSRQEREKEVHDTAIQFLNQEIHHLWPGATTTEGEFRWELLIDATSLASVKESRGSSISPGAERFDSQYWTANVTPSDRYVQSLPGTQKYRISPLDNSFDNLTIAGDWTDCSHNAGCVEAAVMSGRLAAHALSSLPKLEDIIGFDHP